MVFKRPGSRKYWMGPFRAGAVDVPRMSTGQTSKATAAAVERSLQDLAVSGYGDLVQMVADRSLTPEELHVAKIDGAAALQALRDRRDDPLLVDIIEGKPAGAGKERAGGLKEQITDFRQAGGMEVVLDLAPAGARLSWLKDPTHLSELYRRAIAGEDLRAKMGDDRPRGQGERVVLTRQPNSVRRSVHQAVCAILRAQLGRGAMLAIIADADVPGGNDERVVMLSVEEITAALTAADPQFRPVLGLAVTTGIDRQPLQLAIPADYDGEQGTLQVRDGKTSSRPRTLLLRDEPVLSNAEHWLRQLVAGKEPGKPMAPFTNKMIQTRWTMVREAIGRPDVRWKDLRGVFATHYLLAGGDPRDLQHIMGHSTMAMTLRYLRRLPVGNRAQLRARALTAGSWRTPLQVQRGGAS